MGTRLASERPNIRLRELAATVRALQALAGTQRARAGLASWCARHQVGAVVGLFCAALARRAEIRSSSSRATVNRGPLEGLPGARRRGRRAQKRRVAAGARRQPPSRPAAGAGSGRASGKRRTGRTGQLGPWADIALARNEQQRPGTNQAAERPDRVAAPPGAPSSPPRASTRSRALTSSASRRPSEMPCAARREGEGAGRRANTLALPECGSTASSDAYDRLSSRAGVSGRRTLRLLVGGCSILE
jgi:hypothetical protein